MCREKSNSSRHAIDPNLNNSLLGGTHLREHPKHLQ
jgi:hypothetical protein